MRKKRLKKRKLKKTEKRKKSREKKEGKRKLGKKKKLGKRLERRRDKSVELKIDDKTKLKRALLGKKVQQIKGLKLDKLPKKDGAKVDGYKIEIDNAIVNVEIVRSGKGFTYNLEIPEIGVGTAVLLEEIREKLITETAITMHEMLDPKTIMNVKERFMHSAQKMFRDLLPRIDPITEKYLIGRLMQDMLGLGEIEFLVNDPNLEEIVIMNAKEAVRVYHKKYGWLDTNLIIPAEDDILNYSNIIARRVGKQITVLSPLLDAHVVTGDRANAVLYPVSTKGNTITIRKFARDPWTMIDMINNNTCNLEIAALTWFAIEYEMNVLISGGTASGKTSFLNACMPFIPPNHRIISIEDTRELMLPEYLFWCPLVTRTPNQEGKGEVSMLDLLVNSLRMRPDRIILGEMRRHAEAEVLFEAMHTGHSVYATVHADSAAETVSRLINPPISVPPNLLDAVNLNLVMFRDRRKGTRRIYQVAEFMAEGNNVSTNILYRYITEKDTIEKHNESMKFMEDLGRHTGMSINDIKRELKIRENILGWMIKHKIRSLEDVGKLLSIYYTEKEKMLKAVKSNRNPAELLKEQI